MGQSLLSLRKEIDKIDNSILNLIVKRIKIAKKVAGYKKKNNLKISHPKREKEVLNRLRKEAKKKKINAKLIEIIFKNIISDSKKIQKKQNERTD